jgi:hypothetical protein
MLSNFLGDMEGNLPAKFSFCKKKVHTELRKDLLAFSHTKEQRESRYTKFERKNQIKSQQWSSSLQGREAAADEIPCGPVHDSMLRSNWAMASRHRRGARCRGGNAVRTPG